MIVLYDECVTCSFKREKTIADFVDASKCFGEDVEKILIVFGDFDTPSFFKFLCAMGV